MTYEDWCKHSTEIIAEAKRHNDWADKVKHQLLTDIGPRIAKLGKSGYVGCGFHYSLEQNFGRLIDRLALDWQPCANWCENIEGDRMKALGARVSYSLLMKTIKDAEKSLPKWKRTMRGLTK